MTMTDTSTRNKSPLAKLVDSTPFKSDYVLAALGVSQGSWWQIRFGRNKITDAQIVALAAAINVPVGKLRSAAKATRAAYLARTEEE